MFQGIRLVLVLVLTVWLVACSTPTPSTPAVVSPEPASVEATLDPAETTPTDSVEPTVVASSESSQVELVRIGIGADETMLTPYNYVFGYPGYQLMKLIYDSVMELDADNLPQPWLAESVEMSEDGLVYTIVLRNNVLWHDGDSLTAEDVKFTYEYFVAHPEASRFATTSAMVSTIDTPDDLTVIMTLNNPDPTFPLRLADVPVLPAHLWGEVTDPTTFDNTTGSGPYRLVDHQADQFYRFEANPDYFLGTPTVRELVFPIISDQNTMFSALQASEIDFASRGVPPELVAQFEGTNGLTVVKGAGYSATLLQLNDERPPFDNKVVRQAIAYAIDREDIVRTVMLDLATLGNPGFIHPESPVANADLSLDFDPSASQALLDEAGYLDSDGNGTRETPDGAAMEYTVLVYSDSPINIRVAELIQGYLADVGIALTVEALDADSVDALVWPDFNVANGRDFDLAIWGWSASVQNNPSRYIELFHSDPAIGSLNIGGYSNETFDTLADQFSSTLDTNVRNEQLLEMQALVAEELPFVTLFYPNGNFAYRADVYDNYVFIKGLGILNKLSFLPGR